MFFGGAQEVVSGAEKIEGRARARDRYGVGLKEVLGGFA